LLRRIGTVANYVVNDAGFPPRQVASFERLDHVVQDLSGQVIQAREQLRSLRFGVLRGGLANCAELFANLSPALSHPLGELLFAERRSLAQALRKNALTACQLVVEHVLPD